MKLFSKEKMSDGRRNVYLLGKKILSYKKQNKYTKLFAKRLVGLTEKEARYILEQQFKIMAGYDLNLDNPKAFNEKIQWLKLYYKDPLVTKCADKYLVREYIKEKIGEEYLIPLLGVWNNPDEIDFESLPNQFVLKVNWGSGQNIIVKDKTKLDIEETKNKLRNWLKLENNHYYDFLEWAYKDIQPKIVCEEYLKQLDGDLLDYKFMSYNGEIKNLFIVSGRFNDMSIDFYDKDYNRLPFKRLYKNSEKGVDKSKYYNEMLKIAEVLAKPFPFVRVDLYCTENHIYFGELTFYPGNGTERFEPMEWDYKLGELLDLSELKRRNNEYI